MSTKSGHSPLRFIRIVAAFAVIPLAVSALVAAGPSAQAAPSARSGQAAPSGTDTLLVSNYDHQFVATDTGAGGNIRSRSAAPGPWEHWKFVPTGDGDNSFYLWSNQAKNYVSAEFGGQPGTSQYGILDVRSGSTTPGLWETFYYRANSDGTISFGAYDGHGTYYVVAAEESWSGNSKGTLRARTSASSIGPWERFVFTNRFVSGYDDYPAAWKAGKDTFRNLWGWNQECVSFAAWKIYENSGGTQVPRDRNLPSDWRRSIDVVDNWGNAGDWSANAAGNGATGNRTPSVGSIAQWDNNADNGQMKVGHVAEVTAVFPDGGITIAGYNLREDGRFSTLYFRAGQGAVDTSNGHNAWTVPWPDHFIHIKGF
ncbi:CHAP domain-containing protein [Actinomadura gamaensis]|uniref:CHAP domain-containing protein n=1 Tax=Actinomadura gamaensis TaxID=1763541 RepID=A0ABV9TYZ0_9ACTN